MPSPYDLDVDKTTRDPYQQVQLILAAGEIRKIPIKNRFAALLTATDTTKVSVSWRGSSFQPFPAGFLVSEYVSEALWVRNDLGSSNTVTMVIGEGRLEDSRLLLSALAALPVVDTALAALVTASNVLLTAGNALSTSQLAELVAIDGKLKPLANSVFTLKSVAGNNLNVIKASPGKVYSIHILNQSAGPIYLRLYDQITSPVIGTDVGYRAYGVASGLDKQIDLAGGDTFAVGIAMALNGGNSGWNTATAIALDDIQMAVNYQ